MRIYLWEENWIPHIWAIAYGLRWCGHDLGSVFLFFTGEAADAEVGDQT